MKTLDRTVALLLLVFFLVYTFLAFNYPLLPFEKLQSFRPNSMPKGLGILGGILALITLLKATGDKNKDNDGWRNYEWSTFIYTVIALALYATLLKPIGFLLSTTLFLIAGSAILGERNFVKLALIAIISSVIIWVLVDRVLGIFLSPLPRLFS